jgi:hypothetical protein
VQDPSTSGGEITDFYFLNLDFTNDRITLFKRVDGSSSSINGTPVTLSADTWYYPEIHWGTDGTHEVYLYDIDENLVAEFTATDTTHGSGGVGFLTYVSSSDERHYWDHYILGQHSTDHSGGYGPDPFRRTYKEENGASVDLYENYEFFFNYDGIYQPDGSHYFSVGGFFNTYGIVEDYNVGSDSLTKDDVLADNAVDYVELDVQLTKPDGSSVPSSYKGGNNVLMERQDALSDYIFLNDTKWENWKDDELHNEYKRDQIRDEAINVGAISPSEKEDLWLAVAGVGLGFGSLFISGGTSGLVLTGAQHALGGYAILDQLMDEWDCGLSNDNATYDHDYIKLNPCNRVTNPFIGHIVSYRIDYSDLSEPLELTVTQTVHGNVDGVNTKTQRTWKYDIPGSGKMDPGNHSYDRTKG